MNGNFLFLHPDYEGRAVNERKGFSELLPIRISTLVPKDEIWWAQELPDELEVVGSDVRMTRRLKIIHKLHIGDEASK
jgi:hypothetical protein